MRTLVSAPREQTYRCMHGQRRQGGRWWGACVLAFALALVPRAIRSLASCVLASCVCAAPPGPPSLLLRGGGEGEGEGVEERGERGVAGL